MGSLCVCVSVFGKFKKKKSPKQKKKMNEEKKEQKKEVYQGMKKIKRYSENKKKNKNL
jgi:hypothetical protein